MNEAGAIDGFCYGQDEVFSLSGFFFALNSVVFEKNVSFRLCPFVVLAVIFLAYLNDQYC